MFQMTLSSSRMDKRGMTGGSHCWCESEEFQVLNPTKERRLIDLRPFSVQVVRKLGRRPRKENEERAAGLKKGIYFVCEIFRGG